MRAIFNRLVLAGTVLAGLLSSCGEDRSGEYYALITTKTWIYNVMQENYLFYEDIPSEDELDFFDSPQDFLSSAASSKDKKERRAFLSCGFNSHRFASHKHLPVLRIRSGPCPHN